MYYLWKPLLQKANSNKDLLLDSIQFILGRISPEIKKTASVFSIYNRLRADLDWRDSLIESQLNFKSAFTEPIESFIASLADSLEVANGRWPPRLQSAMQVSMRCVELLSATLTESWVRQKLLVGWLLPALADESTPRDVQARLIQASGSIISRCLSTSNDTKLVKVLAQSTLLYLRSPYCTYLCFSVSRPR